jgi:arylsulfatase
MLKIRQSITNGFTLMSMVVVIAFMMAGSVGAQEKLDRTVLPIQEPERPTYSELDVRNVKAPPRFEVKAPAKAP